MNSRKAEEIDTRMQIVQLWSKVKKAIEKNKVPCQQFCKCLFPAERDVQWFLNATQAMIKKIDKGGSRAKNPELAQQDEKGSQQKIEF